ncbi:Aspartyl-tRNA(Asn) amidotransferase subunit C [Liberibacter crescens BT-1]|uniref:Aspartyl/glutamyl-tRNA(Asn/Gln) amidotransferase subunit C n=1 Tax=Liberibacter crescens (strain BT-1) TaxID=1215343 RepID=L0EX73_LIBCB|nr:Asp-tRNA(Asn)/Glu-tRNA(Gln) amidotransferase subunit GatC [Liberibacter crescens]AGA64971.1 Aspartyl-tRNA(Asn) amidotransferase subunit C [Liberibacter crescens BT-1]AMC12990.1 glutamyl-tRNA amidotransferase [Liberibacter crescens]
MSIDRHTIKHIARLARIGMTNDDIDYMAIQLENIVKFLDQISEVDVENVEPMVSVMPMKMKKRDDIITDGKKEKEVIFNAPAVQNNFFLVPKVVE